MSETDTAENHPVEHRFWDIAHGYWRSGPGPWVLTGTLLAIILANIGVSVLLNKWNGAFFQAVQTRNGQGILHAITVFAPLAAVFTALAVLLVLFRARLQIRWREWLTDHMMDRWLTDRRYYQLNLLRFGMDAPEYRIAEDARQATELIVEFAIGILNAGLGAVAFLGILWSVGGGLRLHLGGDIVTIPAYMVLAAVLYTILTTNLMRWLGRRLIPAVERKNQSEADLRVHLTKIREAAESIALIGGEDDERVSLRDRIAAIVEKTIIVARNQARVEWLKAGNGILLMAVPVLLASPKYLDGELNFGQLMQLGTAFTTVQIALGWFVENFPRLADCKASANRVAQLAGAFDYLEETLGAAADSGITIRAGKGRHIELVNLAVTTEDGAVMIQDADQKIERGEKILISGESGTGKSTLIRAIAGLWPWGSGEVVFPEEANVMFLPQKPYIPPGTLRDVLLYPKSETEIADEEIRAAMKLCGLDHLAGDLDKEDAWEKRLSGGEQQRLAFIRVILQKPDIIIMDESTAALDGASQEALMSLVLNDISDATIISVAHRPEMERFHTRKLVLEKRAAGAKIKSKATTFRKLIPKPRLARRAAAQG